MAFVWEITETGKEKLADGEYLAVLKGIEEKINEYGNYIQIEEELDGGRIRYEKFHVGHTDQKKKERAIKSFNLFCFDLTGCALGTKIDEKELLNKKYILTIKNIMFDNGNIWEKAVSRTPVEAAALEVGSPIETPSVMQYGKINIPETIPLIQSNINDEVPF